MGITERKKREKGLRQQQIQKAANELFLQKGFNPTTMEEIAEKAELSPATIYLYFKNKDELFVSLNLIMLEYLLHKMEQIYDNKKISIEKKLYKIKDALFDTYVHNPLILRNTVRIQIEDTLMVISKELVDKINHVSNEIMTMIANIYKEGVRQGKFVNGHGMAHADIIWGLYTGLVVWEEAKRRLNPKKDFLKPTLDKAFDIFYWGIRKNSKSKKR